MTVASTRSQADTGSSAMQRHCLQGGRGGGSCSRWIVAGSVTLAWWAVTRSYLTFSVAGVPGPITQAILRLWSDRADTPGVAIHAVHGSWDEESITAVNAPAIGGAASETGPIAARAWAFADVTRLVPGNGLVSFALTQVGSGKAELGSREGAHSPELLIQTQLTRYPYLTDVAGRNATVNFGTDQSNDSAVVKWGRVGAESCTAHTTTATKTSIMVNGVGEYQWKALLSPLRPDTAYCYRPYFGTSQIDLLQAPTRRHGSPPGFPPVRPSRSRSPLSVTGARRMSTGIRIKPAS
jgi:hypothetical protein